MRRALGEPVIQRTIGGPAMNAIVARWRHGHASIPLSPDGTEHVVLSLSGGQTARFAGRGGSEHFRTEVGRVSLMPRYEPTVAEIEPADALHIFLPTSPVEIRSDRGTPYVDAAVDAVNPAMRHHVLAIFVAIYQEDPDRDLRLDGSVIELAHTIPMVLTRHQRSPSVGGLSPTARRRVEELVASRIDGDFSKPVGLSEMADAARLSVGHFTKMFRKETGMTPYVYASRRRIQRAMLLLTKPATSIEDAAYSAGFSSPSHFVAAFRRHLGVTPALFRDAISNRGRRVTTAIPLSEQHFA